MNELASLNLASATARLVLDEEARRQLWDQHPIVNNEYKLPTPSIDQALGLISEALDFRFRGLAFCGRPGMGKSRAIEYLVKQLNALYPSVPIISFEPKPNRQPSDSSFCRMLMEASHGVISGSKFGQLLVTQVVNKWWALAQDMKSRRLMLTIDEAQLLTELEWLTLKAVANELHKRGIAVTTVPFGQSQLADRRAVLSASKDDDLVNRFMPVCYGFDGLNSVEEVGYVLKWYDSGVDFPPKSGCSLAAFFCSDAVLHGWTMESEAPVLWKAVRSITQHSTLSLGMESFIYAVNMFLINHGRNLPDDTLPLWEEIFRHVGVVYSKPTWNVRVGRRLRDA
jgi:hypothetical protein